MDQSLLDVQWIMSCLVMPKFLTLNVINAGSDILTFSISALCFCSFGQSQLLIYWACGNRSVKFRLPQPLGSACHLAAEEENAPPPSSSGLCLRGNHHHDLTSKKLHHESYPTRTSLEIRNRMTSPTPSARCDFMNQPREQQSSSSLYYAVKTNTRLQVQRTCG